MSGIINFKDNKAKSALSTRWAQMSKQEQIIEKKKMEIQAKLEAQKQAAALAAHAKLNNPTQKDENSSNIFSNDGSFMSQYKALLDKQKKEKEAKAKLEAPLPKVEEKIENSAEEVDENDSRGYGRDSHEGKRRQDRGSRDRQRSRWNERNSHQQHSPTTPVVDNRKRNDKGIPSLMQISVQHPNVDDPDSNEEWDMQGRPGSNDENDSNENSVNMVGTGPMGQGMMGHGPMGPRLMGPGSNMGPGPMMGPGGPPMPPWGGPPNFPNWGPNGPPMPPNMFGPDGSMPPFFPPFNPMMGPNGPPGPPNHMMRHPNSMMGPNGPPNRMMGPNGPHNPMMGPGGPMMRPNGPPNSMMGPNGPPNSMMGPNGPPNSMMGPNGPPNSMMGPNGPPNSMMGPNGPPNSLMGPNGPPNTMMGPNGPPKSLMGPNVPPNSMMGPNGPPNSLMGPNGPPNSMMGPNGPNSIMGPNGPPNSMMGPNGPPNVPANPMMGPNLIGSMNGPPGTNGPPGSMPFMGPQPPFSPSSPRYGSGGQNIPLLPPNMPLDSDSNQDNSNHDTNVSMPIKQLDSGNIPLPPNDSMGGAVQRAASEVAANGDHWENVLKAIHSQDQNLWFLHNQNSNEYKAYRALVDKYKKENQSGKKLEVKDEDKYEPEFSLQDDDTNDSNDAVKDESRESYPYNKSSKGINLPYKREASSQSDEESDSKKERERKRKKKSRWGDEPPATGINPPGILAPLPPGVIAPLPPALAGMGSIAMPPLPPPIQGVQLGKLDEGGFKLTTLNRNNQALMQYAMTNYGTTNLSSEDWTKCEENFKLNLLYQDMMKKRQELDRLAAAGKNKYEYDSDEDTTDGTWEHRLRIKEMAATEKWADELTKQATGKHHIGDFLPPEELKKFMEKYSAVKSGKEPDLSDYKEFKLKEDNVGFKMLQKLGWNEGQGLGVEGTGIVDPINKSNQPIANMGLGASSSDNVSPNDDEFDAYRKRMMLAYRFRPNPLNNPRRPYY